jgi:hypothetical protein
LNTTPGYKQNSEKLIISSIKVEIWLWDGILVLQELSVLRREVASVPAFECFKDTHLSPLTVGCSAFCFNSRAISPDVFTGFKAFLPERPFNQNVLS